MKTFMLAGVALLSLTSMTGAVMAQETPAPSSLPPGDAMTPPPPDAPPAAADPATAADPNAGQPTGAVPADTGMTPAPADVPKDPSAPVGSSANPVTVGGNMTPPPTEAKDYPHCSRTVQDSCINPGEAGKARKPR
ncbi:Fe-S oxidoreductase [Sphingobium sp.]|uniref:Fe-S oxidoreductase n=1 Tax=Sphingobium sp. TaxID=1912891 RepID=UPI002617AE0A|nr:Fe-S oxidoreductase [Sphingobium sp.]